MAGYNAEQLYMMACESYESVKEVVKEATDIVSQAGGDLKLESAMTAMDFIIQATLLNVAVTDGCFQMIERQFIELITEYGDIISFINKEIKKQRSDWESISWNDINDLDEGVKKKLGAIAATVVDPYATSLARVLAAVDNVNKERDYLEIIRKSIGGMIMALSLADGDAVESKKISAESYIGFSILDLLLIKKWEELKK